jgi:hypothetical protein
LVTPWFVLEPPLAAWRSRCGPADLWLESKSVRAFAGTAARRGAAMAQRLPPGSALATGGAARHSVVGAMLGVIYPEVVSPARPPEAGTPGFAVRIAPECSGYEGIGLLLAFLPSTSGSTAASCASRRAGASCRVGAVTMDRQRAAPRGAHRDGTAAGEIALGGFHSQAGWIAFNDRWLRRPF